MHRPTIKLVLLAMVSVALIIAVCAVVISRVLAFQDRASDLSENMSEVQNAIQFVDTDKWENSEYLRVLHDELQQTRLLANSLAYDARWELRFGAAMGWIPLVGNDLAAPTRLIHAAELDLEVAEYLLAAIQAINTFASQLHFPVPGTTEHVGLVDEQAQEIRDALLIARKNLDRAGEWHDALKPLPLSPSLRDYAVSLSDLHLQMGEAVRWSEPIPDLLPLIVQLAQQARNLDGSLPSAEQETGTLDIDSLISDLERFSVLVQVVHDQTSKMIEEAPQAAKETPFWSTFRDLAQLIAILVQVSEAGLAGIEALEPSLMQVQRDGFSVLGDTGLDGFTLVQLLAEREEQMKGAANSLEAAEASLNSFLNNSSLAPLSDLQALAIDLETLAEALRLTASLAPVAKSLWDPESPQHYLVLGHSSDELRATGGYISALWLVTLEKGTVAGVRYFDTVGVDDWSKLASYPKPPPALRDHMNAPVWLLRDVSWVPDFPTAAQLAQDMFWLGQGIRVDGVLGINQWALGELLAALGPISVSGEKEAIDADNFLSFLEKGKDRQGRAYLDVVLQGILPKLRESPDPQVSFRLALAVRRLLETKALVIYSSSPQAQLHLEQLGWAGKLHAGQDDYVFAVNSNVGWSKVDRNIVRHVNYVVDISDLQYPRSQLQLTYKNLSGSTATGCEPQWVTMTSGLGLYEDLKEACYWNYLRVYVPEGITLLGSTSLPLPPGSIAQALSVAEEGEETLMVGSEYGKTVLAGLFTLGAGETKHVQFEYDLPDHVITTGEGLTTYALFLQKQPGAQSQKTTITVKFPAFFELKEVSPAPVSQEGNSVLFDISLLGDTQVYLGFNKVNGDVGE